MYAFGRNNLQFNHPAETDAGVGIRTASIQVASLGHVPALIRGKAWPGHWFKSGFTAAPEY